MWQLRNLLDTVSSDEESIEENNLFSDNEEYYSNPDFSTEVKSNLESNVSDSN